MDPADSSIVYAVLAQQELFRSVNAGRNWARVSRPPGVLLNDLETTGYGLLAGTSAGVFLSTDRGLTWQIRTGNLLATSITGLAIDHQDPPRLYAGDANAGIFKTTRRERPWLRLGDIAEPFAWAPAVSFAASPLVEGTLWAGGPGAMGKVRRSRDGGLTWQDFSTGLPSVAIVELTPDPVDPATLYAATEGDGIFKSTDAGETWSLAGLWTPGVRFQNGLVIDPADPSIVYAGTDGLGVLRLDQEN